MSVNKLSAISAVAIALFATSCGDPEHEAAIRLDASVDSAMNASDYQLAITLIDSLNSAYPREIELRKASNVKRVKAVEQMTMTQIPLADEKIARYQATIDSLNGLFETRQPSKSLPPYLVPKTLAKKNFADAAGIEPRVNTGQDAVDTPWTLAVNAGRDIAVHSITITTSGGADFTIELPVSDGQMATATPERMQPLGKYLADNPADAAISAVILGAKGKTSVKLSPEVSRGIADAYALGCANDSLYKAKVVREKLERALQIARDQSANLPQPAAEK